MLAVLSRRLRYLTGLAEDLSLREVPGRLAAYLVRLGESEGSQRVELKISKGQLAEVLGTTPESLSRALARLSALGFIDVRGNFINIEDLTALRKVADQGR
jgi:CRP/FNR family transcriptional regulator